MSGNRLVKYAQIYHAQIYLNDTMLRMVLPF